MEITKTQKVQIDYQVIDGDLSYMDILVYTPEEFANLTDNDINQAITDKYSKWKSYIENPN